MIEYDTSVGSVRTDPYEIRPRDHVPARGQFPEQGLNVAKPIKNSDFHLMNNAGHEIQIYQSKPLIRQ